MDEGYEQDIFERKDLGNYECPVCTLIVRFPKMCSICQTLICEGCANLIINKKTKWQCPNNCQAAQLVGLSKFSLKAYLSLLLYCKKCQKKMRLEEYIQHEPNCVPGAGVGSKCRNFFYCQKAVKNGGDYYCSMLCEAVYEYRAQSVKQKRFTLIKEILNNPKHWCQDFFAPISNQIIGNLAAEGIVEGFRWSKAHSSPKVQISSGGTEVFLNEEPYCFLSVNSEKGFMKGIHYWEIEVNEDSENEMKFGVSSKNVYNYSTAFCDQSFGWGFYGTGAIRHDSKTKGETYGERLKNEGTLCILLNMDEGSLKFGIKKNQMEKCWGVAFNNPKLKEGPLYPAVSLIHKCGFKTHFPKSIPPFML